MNTPPHAPTKPPSRWPGHLATWALITLVAGRTLVLLDRRLPSETLGDLAGGTAFLEPLGLFLDLALVGVMALALVDAVRNGRAVRWVLTCLWAVGAMWAVAHAWSDAMHQMPGLGWVGASAAALAAVHLGADPARRRLLLGGAVALLVPLLFDGVFQYSYQHDQVVAEYQAHRAQHHQRMDHDPNTIEKYERRLMQRESRGPFPFSNIYATVVMALGLLALGTAWGLRRNGAAWPVTFGFLALGIGGLGAVFLSGSKGAAVACAATAAATLATAWLAARIRNKKRLWVVTVFGVTCLGFVAVLGRGAMGPPETATGERSLLFRSHYWSAAAKMLAQAPLAGVGPGRFQHAYLRHKPPINPEEVADPHNVAVALIACLGVGGMAWALMLGVMAWRTGAGAAEEARPSEDTPPPHDPWLLPGGCAALALALTGDHLSRFVLGIAASVRLDFLIVTLVPMAAAAGAAIIGWRGLGNMTRRASFWVAAGLLALGIGLTLVVSVDLGVWAGGAIGAMVCLWAWMRWMDASTWPSWALVTAATAILLHSQIEMGLSFAMSAPLLWMLIGLAASDPLNKKQSRPPWTAPTVAAVGGAIWLGGMFFFFWPSMRHAAALTQAATAETQGQTHHVFEHLNTAHHHRPTDERTVRLLIHQMVQEATWHHQQKTFEQRDQWLAAAEVLLHASIERCPFPVQYRHIQTLLHRWAAKQIGGPWIQSAADAAERELAERPHAIQAHLVAAETALEAGRPDRAARWFKRALALDDLAYLDPLQQLTHAQRRQTQQRLDQVKKSAATQESTPGFSPTP